MTGRQHRHCRFPLHLNGDLRLPLLTGRRHRSQDRSFMDLISSNHSSRSHLRPFLSLGRRALPHRSQLSLPKYVASSPLPPFRSHLPTSNRQGLGPRIRIDHTSLWSWTLGGRSQRGARTGSRLHVGRAFRDALPCSARVHGDENALS